MKKIFSNNRLLVVAFFTVFSVAASPAVRANDSSYVVPVELKVIGSINNQSLVQLSFAGNSEDNEFTIIIKDDQGNPLYRENIKGESFYKKFLLNNDDFDNSVIRFEVISKRTNKTVVFEVNRKYNLVDEMVVNKVK